MTNTYTETLYRCIIAIDDTFIEEAQDVELRTKDTALKPWLSLAACFGLILIIGAAVLFPRDMMKLEAPATENYTITLSYENGKNPETLSVSYREIADGLKIPVTLADGSTVQALNIAPDTDDTSEAGTMTPENVEYYAYMDYDEASDELKPLVLAARNQIIYSRSWAADGVEVIVKRSDGTEERVPAFSELFPGWELPVDDKEYEFTPEGLNYEVQYGILAEVLEIGSDHMMCRTTVNAHPFEEGQIIKVYYPEGFDTDSLKEGEILLVAFYGKDCNRKSATICAMEIER